MAEALHLREVVVVAQQPQLPQARWPQLAAWEHNRRLWSPLQRLSFDSANNEWIANGDLLTHNAALRAAEQLLNFKQASGVLKRTKNPRVPLVSARGSPMIEKRHRSRETASGAPLYSPQLPQVYTYRGSRGVNLDHR